MTTILIISPQPNNLKRVSKVLGSDFSTGGADITVIDQAGNLGIEIARELKSFALRPPMKSKRRLILILEASRLTVEAQNALLKILEEPPHYCQFVLTTKQSEELLPTVVSRCRVLYDKVVFKADLEEIDQDWLKILTGGSNTEKLLAAEKMGNNREAAIKKTEALITQLRQELLAKPLSATTATDIRLAEDCLMRLKGNAHVRLTLDRLALKLGNMTG